MMHTRWMSFRNPFRKALLFILLAATVLLGVQPVFAADCPVGSRCIFLPAVANHRPSGDLVISGVEVTQAIQDMQNSVPLVAGRRTVMRIYARTAESPQPLSNVEIRITASTDGVALPGSPAVLTATLPLTSNRADLKTTINVDLPSAWLSKKVDLTVQLDPNDRIAETNETNNKTALRLTFNSIPALQIKIVPIQYTHINGVVYPAPKTDTISDWIRRTYPISQVDISWHAAYGFSGDLSSTDSWFRLLNAIASLKDAEGAPAAQVYYALVPITNGVSTWFTSGVAGIGLVGSRVSVGLNVTPGAGQIAAHEIGHNLGMLHSPCGSVSSLDPDYPYSDGSIGQYGLDVFSKTLYEPDYLDMMSYCAPKWISDYTYKVLYNSQAAVVSSTTQMLVMSESLPQNSLLVRYQIDPGGVQALPAYALSTPPQSQPEPGDYSVQVLDSEDALLSETRVRAYSVEVGGVERSAIHALIPYDGRSSARLRLLKDGRVLSEQMVQAEAPQKIGPVEMATGGGARVRWTGGERPALVRYTTDGGQTWTILGIDITGGELQLNPAALPEPGAQFEVILAGAWE